MITVNAVLVHDLESFFYCLIWHGLGYETLDKYPCENGHDEDILNGWWTGDYIDIAYRKSAFMTSTLLHKMFNRFLDKAFADKCKVLWRNFRDTELAYDALIVCEGKGIALVTRPLPESSKERRTKVTAPMIIRALGVSQGSTDCEDGCCMQLCRRPEGNCN